MENSIYVPDCYLQKNNCFDIGYLIVYILRLYGYIKFGRFIDVGASPLRGSFCILHNLELRVANLKFMDLKIECSWE